MGNITRLGLRHLRHLDFERRSSIISHELTNLHNSYRSLRQPCIGEAASNPVSDALWAGARSPHTRPEFVIANEALICPFSFVSFMLRVCVGFCIDVRCSNMSLRLRREYQKFKFCDSVSYASSLSFLLSDSLTA